MPVLGLADNPSRPAESDPSTSGEVVRADRPIIPELGGEHSATQVPIGPRVRARDREQPVSPCRLGHRNTGGEDAPNRSCPQVAHSPVIAPGNRGWSCPVPPAPACRFSQRSIGLGDGSGSRPGDRPRADPGDSHPPRLSSASRLVSSSTMWRVSGRDRASRSRWGDVEGVRSATRRERLAYAGSVESDARRRSWCTATRFVNTRYVNGSQRHPYDLTTYHWGPAGCHHRHGGGADQTVAPRTGATRTST